VVVPRYSLLLPIWTLILLNWGFLPFGYRLPKGPMPCVFTTWTSFRSVPLCYIMLCAFPTPPSGADAPPSHTGTHIIWGIVYRCPLLCSKDKLKTYEKPRGTSNQYLLFCMSSPSCYLPISRQLRLKPLRF
jgi:hypothetical protein